MKPNKVNPFIDTKNTDKVIQLAKNVVNNREWLIVVGEVGAGKSFLRKELANFYNAYPTKFTVVDMGKCFEGSHLSIGNIMKSMLQKIAPDEIIPGNIQGKYELLRKTLANHSKRIVLLFDEAQNISQSGMRDLKMIHEIDHGDREHLFSIIMFGKNSARWEHILNGHEIGWRVRKTQLYKLDRTEILNFACKSHGLKFESGRSGDRAKEIFLSDTTPTPLGVKHKVEEIYSFIPNFDGTITEEIMTKTITTSRKEMMKRYKISQKSIQTRLEEAGIIVDKSTISRVLNHDTDGLKPDTCENILNAFLEEVEEATSGQKSRSFRQAVNS